MRERPLVFSEASLRGCRARVAIGYEAGQLAAFLEEEEGVHSRFYFLCGGPDRYEIWRSYMKELARLEEENWVFSRRELPRPSEIESLHSAPGE